VKEIPLAFRQNGFEFKLLLREGSIGLFRKTKPGLGFESFEVVIIQRHDTFVIHGKEIEPPNTYHHPGNGASKVGRTLIASRQTESLIN
jgi:hypothetical protein